MLHAESSDINNLWDVLIDLSSPFLSIDDHPIVERRKRALLYSLQRSFADKMLGQTNQEQTIGVLQRAIFAGVRLSSSSSPDRGESLLGRVLAKGVGDCVGLVSVYLGIARLFGINMRAAFADKHVFLVFDWESGNATIETTRKGMIQEMNLPAYLQDGSTWIPYKETQARTLTDREFLGVVLNNRAIFYYAKRRDWKSVQRDLMQAKEFFPDHPDIEHNMSLLPKVV